MNLLFAAAAATDCALPEIAHGQIFVLNNAANAIGAYDFDGTPINPALIAGLSFPNFMAASGSTLFVTTGSGKVGAYSTSGATINASLITGIAVPQGGLATSGSYLYVTSELGAIGKYNFDGSPVNASFITDFPSIPIAIAVSAGSLFVTNLDGTIGKYDAASGATVNAAFASGAPSAGIAVSGGLIYTSGGGTIGVYDATTGATLNSALISGLSGARGIAISGSSLFVSNSVGGYVGVYSLDGTVVSTSLFSVNTPYGIVVSGIPEPSTYAALIGLAVLARALIGVRKRMAGSSMLPVKIWTGSGRSRFRLPHRQHPPEHRSP